MSTNIIERLFIEVGLDFSKLASEADKAIATSNKLEGALSGTEKASGKANKALGELSKGKAKAATGAENFAKSMTKATKVLSAFFATILVSTGLNKLINEVQKANGELYFLEKNLGMSAQSLKSWQNAAAASGGTAEGMTASLKGLSRTMNDFVIMGDTSMLPYFNALGVSMVDSYGKVRQLDDVMLDLSDSLSRMDRKQAYSIGAAMGLDEGTLNTLLQGRDAMQEILAIQKSMYHSSEQELEASRELSRQQAILSAHWESLKTMVANALIPILLKLTKVVNEWMGFIQRNERAVRHVFEALALIIGAILIPLFSKALMAALAFIAPFAPFILVVTALSAAFILLYDDYKTWAEGGKSLFDWGAFTNYINTSRVSVENLKSAFAFLLTGYKSWSEFAANGGIWKMLSDFADDSWKRVVRLWEALKKIFEGDFSGGFGDVWELVKESYTRPFERVAGAIDTATGHEVGTLAGTDVVNRPKQNMYSMDAGVEVAKSAIGGGGRKATQWDDLKLKRVNATYNGKKVIESIGGGETEQGTKEFAKTMQDKLGNRLKHFGAFNDVYHKQKSPNSGHARGLKFDMTLNNDAGQKASEAEGRKLAPGIVKQMRAELDAKGFKEGRDYVINDEYNNPSGKATAGHIDFGWKNKEAAARYAGMMTGQPSASQPSKKSKASNSFQQKRKEAIEYFMSQGWTREQAIGIAANLEKESSWDHQAVGDNGKAYGSAQWHPPRQAGFKQKFGKDIRQSTFKEQLAYVDYELKNGYYKKRAGDKLKAAKSAEEAAEIVSSYYEEPADKRGEAIKRKALATQISQSFNPGAGLKNGAQQAQQSVAAGQQKATASAPITNNKTLSVVLNGGVNVASSATNIDGTVSDGFNAVNNRVNQLITGMS